MPISGIGQITGAASTLHGALLSAADPGAARSLSTGSASTAGDPLDPGSFVLPGGYGDGYGRTVTTTVDEITIDVNVTRVTKDGAADAASGAAPDNSAGDTYHIQVTTVYDPSTGKTTRSVIDPVKATSGTVDNAQIDAIERKLQDGDGVLAGNVSIDDQRSTTQTVYKTVLEPDGTGHLQSVRTEESQSSSLEYSDKVKSASTFDATDPDVGSATDVATSLLGKFTSSDWLNANIPGLHISEQA